MRAILHARFGFGHGAAEDDVFDILRRDGGIFFEQARE